MMPSRHTLCDSASSALVRTYSSGSESELIGDVQIRGLSSPLQHPETRHIPLKPGGVVPVELDVYVEKDPTRCRAELWTNATRAPDDSPRAIPMELAHTEGRRAVFRGVIPVRDIGNFYATGRVYRGRSQRPRWANDAQHEDLRFRPRDPAHDAHDIMTVHVGMANCDEASETYGTFADMMSEGSPLTNGKYTLGWLHEQGVNMLWLQGLLPSRFFPGPGREHDRAGSPYAATDFFAVRPELAASARGLEGEAAREAALREFAAFREKAASLGMSLLLDIAPNHVGHDFTFRDLFVTRDAEGREVREVRKNDFSLVALDSQHKDQIHTLRDTSDRRFLEDLAPFMYARRDRHGAGARSRDEMISGGWEVWDQWPDTKQLNHGRVRTGAAAWSDVDPSPEQERVRGWLDRVAEFWVIDMGVRAVRWDHLSGLPEDFLRSSTNRIQADLARRHPGERFFLVGEDFNTQNFSRHWLDNEQGGFFRRFRDVRTAADFQKTIDDPWRHDLLSLGSHDEERAVRFFPSAEAYAQMSALTRLVGGPVLRVMGDEFGEMARLAFCQYRTVPSFGSPNEVARSLAQHGARVAEAKRALPALTRGEREWLTPSPNDGEPDLVAFSRLTSEPSEAPVFVVANLNEAAPRQRTFLLGSNLRGRLERVGLDRRYQAHDFLSEEAPARPLWSAPKTGWELSSEGLYVDLAPRQTQAIALTPC